MREEGKGQSNKIRKEGRSRDTTLKNKRVINEEIENKERRRKGGRKKEMEEKKK